MHMLILNNIDLFFNKKIINTKKNDLVFIKIFIQMFQYDYADYSIFFLIYWDALEDYMSYNETNMFNLDYEEICMDLIRDDLNEKYDFDEYDDLDEDTNIIQYIFVDNFTSTFEDMIFNYKMNFILNLTRVKRVKNILCVSNH